VDTPRRWTPPTKTVRWNPEYSGSDDSASDKHCRKITEAAAAQGAVPRHHSVTRFPLTFGGCGTPFLSFSHRLLRTLRRLEKVHSMKCSLNISFPPFVFLSLSYFTLIYLWLRTTLVFFTRHLITISALALLG
jgi:hypothetical protein